MSDAPWRSILKTRRLASVALLSLSSGLPLGLVLTSVPAFLAMAQVDIKTIGWLSLAQAPYAFKFVWAPLLDRFQLPFLGRHRGFIALFQLLLALCTAALGLTSSVPDIVAVGVLTLLLAFVSASQDIAVDAYAVEALEKDEQGAAVGARTALYRAGMWLSGNIAITLAPLWGWKTTLLGLASLYVALLGVTVRAPAAGQPHSPPKTLREAVWQPFVGFLSQPRALEMAAFLLLYKLADNLAAALIRPFLVERGYSAFDVGVASGTVGLVATLLGTFAGGLLTSALGVGRALWLFGILQAVSNLGYVFVAQEAPSRLLMYSAMAIESATTGLGTGAFSVLLLRLTQRRFSATQFALFSSIFALGRTVVGPLAGITIDALGWSTFFLLTIPCALPGLFMLNRFAPWGQRDIPEPGELPASFVTLALPKKSGPVVLGAGLSATAFALLANALLASLKAVRNQTPFDFLLHLEAIVLPHSVGAAVDGLSCVVFGGVVALGVLAWLSVRPKTPG